MQENAESDRHSHHHQPSNSGQELNNGRKISCITIIIYYSILFIFVYKVILIFSFSVLIIAENGVGDNSDNSPNKHPDKNKGTVTLTIFQ